MNFRKTGFILAVIVVLYGTTVKVSESNSACGFCHTHEHERWEVSTHKVNDCRDCHIEPGISGALEAQFNGLQNLFVAVFKGTDIQPHEDPLPISTQNCLGCHGAIMYITELGFEDLPDSKLLDQSLKISHRTHLEKYKIDCVECHRGVVHNNPEEKGKYKTNWPFMKKDCAACHNGEFSDRFQVDVSGVEDKTKCIVCHPAYIPPEEIK